MSPASSEHGRQRHSGLVFLTGCYRSGTTLLQKALDAHPSLSVAMQPFPVWYFEAKERFLDKRGLPWRYPLDHLFLEDRYEPQHLGAFLAQLRVSEDELDALFARLAAYGTYTPGADGVRDRIRAASFFDVHRQWNRAVADLAGKGDVPVVGNKEIFCEEYVPFLLEDGARVVVILRDPRDLIASVHYRVRDNQTGDPRPVLFSLRAWRKSVAFALAYASHPSFRWLRYEDLTAEPLSQLGLLTALLQVPPFDPGAFAAGIPLRDGSIWRSNSSFEHVVGISGAGRGRYQKLLPEEVVRYVEAVCWPEMRAVGYPLEGSGAADEQLLLGFHEPGPRVHHKFPADYSRSPDRIARELERLQHLRPGEVPLAATDARKWFIAPEAYATLRRVAAG